MYHSVELFAGAGGLGLGLHRAGFVPRKVVEFNKWCCNSLRENISEISKPEIVEGDVRSVEFSELEGKIDLISGGPPCQPFSMGGRHLAHADTRDMFPEAVRAVREAKPKVFIFENVKGLTRVTFRPYYEYIRLQMSYPDIAPKDEEDWTDHKSRLERHHTSKRRTGLKYNVLIDLLDAANYGVPQRRHRVFFVGFRSDIDAAWSFPKPTHSAEALAWDMTHGDYWDRHKVIRAHRTQARKAPLEKPGTQAWATVRDAIGNLPSFGTRIAISLNHFHQTGAKSYPGHTGSYVDDPSKALKAGVHGVPGGENMVRMPDGSVRYYSVREAARLQAFPDQHKFAGAWTECMRQIGNAVPVTLAEAVGAGVRKHLEKELCQDTQS